MNRLSHRRLSGLAVAALVAALAASMPAQEGFAQAWQVIPPTQTMPAAPLDPNAPSGTVENLKILPDRLGLDGSGLARFGLRLEVDFTIRNFAGRRGRTDIFFRPQNGDFISGGEGFYASIEGLVSVRRYFKTRTNDDKFESIGLFIPHDELRLAEGDYTMETVILLRSADRLLGRATFSFPYRHRARKAIDAPQEP